MKHFVCAGLKCAAVAAALSSIGVPAAARDWHDRGDYGHHGRYDRGYDYDDVRLRGPGVDDLDPWLRNAKNGRRYVMEILGTNRVSNRDAWIVNRELARSRSGWNRRDRYRDRW